MYNSKTKSIEMYYRKEKSNDLHHVSIPFDHYIFISPNYRRYGVIEDENTYTHLSSGDQLIQIFVDPSEAKKLYQTTSYVTGEADLSPEQRFICDNFYDTEFPSNLMPRIFYIDIEAWVNDGKIPSFSNNNAEINAITIYDNYTKTYYSWFLVPPSYTDSHEDIITKIDESVSDYSIHTEIKIFRDPALLLSAFSHFIKTNCPDIITAWNSQFDIPYITRKIYDYFGNEGLKILSPFNRVSSKITSALESGIELSIDTLIPGISVIDMMQLYKKNADTERPSYALKNITAFELGESKVQSEDSSDPTQMFLNEFITFCKYNIQDTRLLVLLEEKLKIINLAITIRNISKVDFQDIFSESRIIDYLFIMEAVRRRNAGGKIVLPSKPKHIMKQKYLGAYVKETLAGRFKWVADLDFKSLYPSIVKTFKLSSETLVGNVREYQQVILYNTAKEFRLDNLKYVYEELLPKYFEMDNFLESNIDNLTLKDLNNSKLNVNYYSLYKDNNYSSEFNSISEFNQWLRDNNFVMLSNGVIVDQNKDDAIIAKVIADIMDSREKYKKLMYDYLAKGNEEMHNVYNVYQTAVKVINNSVYGVTANEGFRLFNIDISEGITTTGQTLIRASTYVVNKFLNELASTKDVDYVITNDTDSIIFTLQNVVNYPIETRDAEILKEIASYAVQCMNIVNESVYSLAKNIFNKSKINKSNNYLTIKTEWLANAGIFVAKKAYAIHMVFKEGVPYEKLKSVGISLKRSGTPKAMKPFLEKVLTKILEYETKDEIDKLIALEVDKLKNEYELKDIALPISVNDISSYTKNVPVHVRGSKIWNKYFAKTEMDKVITGKVKYIYVKRWLTEPQLNEEGAYVLAVPDKESYWQAINEKIEVDYSKMRERLISKPVAAFYTALGWKLPSVAITDNNGTLNKVVNKSKSKLKLI